MAALQASEMDIAALRETLGPMRVAVMNRHFHQAVYHAARNGFLYHAIEIPRSRHRIDDRCHGAAARHHLS